ncbi:dephospho-CoA kinase [Tepidibacillus sp. HK-1]|uniref:dephospho-CoA kinase n=1 Tax=Tepidibacillus sp. HK-1 TaxID=1883407 RepID=UPI000852D3B8|nr:dephospho-CoA kinase [Tepidibacillus sp. HK-1]GBF11793.1 dephospho-CoA kinase [Tepidibacillus sp. HK-1]
MLIGLTGGIGSGKSTVSNLFAKYGIPVIDVDQIAREIVKPGEEAWQMIIDHFGSEILLPDQTIDRKKLGKIIFNDSQKREILNEITHPIIFASLVKRAKELQTKYDHVIVDIPLLFESKRERLFDLIVVVYVDPKIQLSRLMERDRITKEEALSKIRAQLDLNLKKEMADIVIDNSLGISNTELQVVECIKKWYGKLD